MRSSFIFCLLAMYYIASANANPCWDIPGVPCLRLCEDLHEGQKLTTKAPDTRCTLAQKSSARRELAGRGAVFIACFGI
uniref:Putative salivary kunitz domain protein n=1 Tax=Ixodes ricinus TaxID=34613 RepID=A0A0K8R6J8_IXORI